MTFLVYPVAMQRLDDIEGARTVKYEAYKKYWPPTYIVKLPSLFVVPLKCTKKRVGDIVNTKDKKMLMKFFLFILAYFYFFGQQSLKSIGRASAKQ